MSRFFLKNSGRVMAAMVVVSGLIGVAPPALPMGSDRVVPATGGAPVMAQHSRPAQLTTGVAVPTSCGVQASEQGLRPVLQISLPQNASWSGQTPPYSFNDTAAVAQGFDRIGYCLELGNATKNDWAWAAMEPFTQDSSRLGIPTQSDAIVRQRVNDLDVASNLSNVPTGTKMTGYLEMWPHAYGPTASGQISHTWSSIFDADDRPSSGTGLYGSFQIHRVGMTPTSTDKAKTIMAVNGFTAGDVMDVGIGTPGGPNPDSTGVKNAAKYTKRQLTVYARAATAKVTVAPSDRQLYPRDASGGATLAIEGTVLSSTVSEVRLVTTVQGVSTTTTQPGPDFSFAPRIQAGLFEYDFSLETVANGRVRQVGHWSHIVSGDVFVIQGQSNAESAPYVESGSASQATPWARSYGSTTMSPSLSGLSRQWNYAVGDTVGDNGAVGQWGVRMARSLTEQLRVPVAIVNGALGGKKIDYFQRNDSQPNDLNTNYGRLKSRLAAAGVLSQVRGVLWYQGESDAGKTSVHIAGFASLLADWRADIGGPDTRYFTFQIRGSCSATINDLALRDAQRQLSVDQDLTVLSTTGIPGHDGCHYNWTTGSRLIGDQATATVIRDLYDGPSDNVAAPNPVSASLVSSTATEIVLHLANTDTLTVDQGVGADFRVVGADVTVSDVRYESGGRLILTLSGPATGVTALSYVSHTGFGGPMIRTSLGMGLLAFDSLPVTVG
ncbi:MAG: sialate O-acetylesterase [Rhodoglobus sp.]